MDWIYEDDPEMGLFYDLQVYFDDPRNYTVGAQFTLDFIDSIEKQINNCSKISHKQFEVLKQIYNRLGLNSRDEE
jgi:hypothetical protein